MSWHRGLNTNHQPCGRSNKGLDHYASRERKRWAHPNPQRNIQWSPSRLQRSCQGATTGLTPGTTTTPLPGGTSLMAASGRRGPRLTVHTPTKWPGVSANPAERKRRARLHSSTWSQHRGPALFGRSPIWWHHGAPPDALRESRALTAIRGLPLTNSARNATSFNDGQRLRN